MSIDEKTLREDILAAFINAGYSDDAAGAKTDVALGAAAIVPTTVPLSATSNEALKKPRPQWADRTDGDVEAHLRGAYANEIKTDTLGTSLVFRDDRAFYVKLKGWLRTHKLPSDIHLHETRAEQKADNTKKLEEVGPLTLGRLLSRLRKESDTNTRELIRLYDLNKRRHERETASEVFSPSLQRQQRSRQPRPKWHERTGDDTKLTTEEFVAKYYAAEKKAVTPRPQWDENGEYGNRPAEFIAIAYRPEMLAGTLHRALVGREQKGLAVRLTSLYRTRRLPKGIDIPTKPEWNTRQIKHREEIGDPIRPNRVPTEETRLYDARRYRKTQARSP